MGEHIQPVSTLQSRLVGEGDYVAARRRGDAARGRMEGRKVRGLMVPLMDPSYAHRLMHVQIISGFEQERIGIRCDKRAVSACERQEVTLSRVHSMTTVIKLASNESLSRRSDRRPVVSVPEIDAAFGQIVDGQLQPYVIPREDSDTVPAHASRCVCCEPQWRALMIVNSWT